MTWQDDVKQRLKERAAERKKYFKPLYKGTGLEFQTPIRTTLSKSARQVGRGTRSKSIGRKRMRDEKKSGTNWSKDNPRSGLKLGG